MTRCICPVRSDAIGPHTRGCPNHPEYRSHGDWRSPAVQDAAALDYAETAPSEAYAVLRRIVKGTDDPRQVAADFPEAHGFECAAIDPIGFAAAIYDVPRELVEGARDHLDDDCSGCSMPDGRHWDTCPNRWDGRPAR